MKNVLFSGVMSALVTPLTPEETLNEDSANVAYELTFLMMGVVCAVYVLGIKKQNEDDSRQ